jgi:hypothetical protein
MPRVRLTKGAIDALPTATSDVVYWVGGCPDREGAGTRMTLVRPRAWAQTVLNFLGYRQVIRRPTGRWRTHITLMRSLFASS